MNDDKLLSYLPLELPHEQKNEYHSFLFHREKRTIGKDSSRKCGMSLGELDRLENKNAKKLIKTNKIKKQSQD